MPEIILEDVTKIYPFQKVTGIFGRKQQKLVLQQQQKMPYTSNEGVVALQHFSCRIEDGEFVAVLGPSGSGKSTLLRVIAGLETPSLGKVIFDGQEMNYVRAEERNIAMVFQNFALYPNQTVYKNIAFPLEVQHVPREEIEAEVHKVAEVMNLTRKLEKLPDELSGGEMQRVALARALVRKPAILLLDEPFSNLDVEMRRVLRVLLKKVHEVYKTTFIYVTHDQYDALSLADRIIILKDGITQMDDTTANVYNYPVNRFCGEFIGFPAMNIIEDINVRKDGSYSLFGNDYKLTYSQKANLKSSHKVDIGIRGTNIEIADKGVEAVISYVEIIEADMIIHVKVDNQELSVVEKMNNSSEMKYLTGQTVFLKLDQEYFHVFDKEGIRI